MQGRRATGRSERIDRARDKAKGRRGRKGKGKKDDKYETRRGGKDKSPDNFDEFQDSYNLRKKGAGSEKNPKRSRFSAKDVTNMFEAGQKRFDLSDKDAARKVLDYADDMEGRTRMGGGTKRALDRLRSLLKKENQRPTEPNKNNDRPEEVRRDQERFEETRLDRPENQMPRLEGAYAGGDNQEGQKDANLAAIRGGDDLNEWYQTKFVPHLEADANATNSEIGDDSRYFLDKFAFEPPALGNVQDVFEKYKKEIEDLD